MNMFDDENPCKEDLKANEEDGKYVIKDVSNVEHETPNTKWGALYGIENLFLKQNLLQKQSLKIFCKSNNVKVVEITKWKSK